MKTNLIRQVWRRVLPIMLLLLGMVPNIGAVQYGFTIQESFTAYEKQPGVIHFKLLAVHKGSLPVTDLAGAVNYDQTLAKGGGSVYMCRPGHEDVLLFRYYSKLASINDSIGGGIGWISNINAMAWMAHNGAVATTIPIEDYGYHSGTDSLPDIHYELSKDYTFKDGDNELDYFGEWDWYMPAEFNGLEGVSFKVVLDTYSEAPNHESGKYAYSNLIHAGTYTYTILENVKFPTTIPEAPELQDAQIAIDLGDGKAKPGTLMLNVTSAPNKIYSYTLPGEKEVRPSTVQNNATIYIPISDVERKGYRIDVKQVFNGADEGSLFEQYNLYDNQTNAINIPAYHKIHNMKVDWVTDSVGLRNGDVRVSWKIEHPEEKDIMENDLFIVERDTTPDFTNPTQLELLYYEKGKADYEMIDQSDDVKRQDAPRGRYYYRVRRASTSMWTDMKKVVASGLAAEDVLQCAIGFGHNAEIVKGYLSSLFRHADASIYEVYHYFMGDNSLSIDYRGTKSCSEYSELMRNLPYSFFDYPFDSLFVIYQPTIGQCSAVAAPDWTTSRRIQISANVGQIKQDRMDTRIISTGCPSDLHEYNVSTNYYISRNVVPKENNIYWDKERTKLYLVRRMIIDKDTTETQFPVSADAIVYNPTTRQYEITTTDVADVPCARYEYYFRVDATNTPLPCTGNPVSEIAEAESQFYFNDGMHLSSVSASDRISPDFTDIRWETTGGEFEQYEVWRRRNANDNANANQWEKIETVQAKSYLDRRAPIGVPCQYKIVGILNCDGHLTDTSAVANGQRDCYGSISGYVTYTNGVVRPNTQLKFTLNADPNIYYFATTDSLGYYHRDSLLFTEEGMAYRVSVPEDKDDAFLTAAGAKLPILVNLTGVLATHTDINIQYTRCKRMEGRILYENSTVPVAHVQFEMDERPIIDKDGKPIETDASGNFDLMVESGQHKIRAIKAGHTFANQGLFTDEEGDTLINFTDNLYGKRLYDQTRILLAGRVTGGLTEGTKELGLGRSTNTLGDNLTLVFELEGDNISRFVYYPTHPDITERDTVFYHPTEGDSTTMHMEAKRIIVHPDPRTGEYLVNLFPARYKVTQAYANGYATLFPTGMTSQAIDMSDALHIEGEIDTIIKHPTTGTATEIKLPYNYRYQITYRNPIHLNYQQVVYGMPKDYMGEEKMHYQNIFGADSTIHIVLRDTLNRMTGYLFGYPVFRSQNMFNKYTYRITATEDYYYNGDLSSARHWQEYIVNEDVTLFNGMSSRKEELHGYIDPVTRSANIEITVDNPSFVLTGESALRQIEIGMQVDGEYIYAEPIRGYVDGSRAKGTDAACAIGQTIDLLDCLRDPYGANSYSYIEAGTSYNAHYTNQKRYKGGINLKFTTGANTSNSLGSVAAPMGGGAYMGTVSLKSTVETAFEIPIEGIYEYYENADYTFTTKERIATSSDPSMVGADADIYIGTTTNVYIGMTDAVTVIDSTTYRMMQPAIRAGKVHLLAEPTDQSPFYLVVGEQMEVGNTYPVRFAYTQHYLMNVLLPKYFQNRNALLMANDPVLLQQLADSTGNTTYGTLVGPDDDNYGLEGYYQPYYPTGSTTSDVVAQYNTSIAKWIEIIAANEKTKVEAPTNGSLLNTYSLDGGTNINYSESAAHSYAADSHIRWGEMFGDLGGGLGKGAWALISAWKKKGKDEPAKKTEFSVFGTKFGFDFNTIWESGGAGANNQLTKGNSKSTGFVLATSGQSYEDIDVYRLTGSQYMEDNDDAYDLAHSDVSGSKKDDDAVYADFVFLRRGGATRCPYQAADSTIFYTVGNQRAVLGAATVAIDVPTISINLREQSNVPMDQPATFVLTLSNESSITYDSKWPTPTFTLSQTEGSNPNGLVIMMDGMPIKQGVSFPLKQGESIQKTIQVYRGTEYDYDDVELTLRSECDGSSKASILFNVHYQPVSCPVSMTLPVKNWIMNTLSPQDDKGYYLPVEISGFDIHYDNFDHIDLQYKLRTQSDDQWTTQCSFYADSARYVLASGNKAMIENGQIRNVRFYGERDPMEQQYDLRAVSFCRFGNDFITRSSELHSGLKDTRVPQLFGAATPANGILQVGDYISIPFSEPIAANYLDEDYNFEIVGYTNASRVNESTSISFPAGGKSFAITELSHNLSNKDFSVDLLVMPAEADRTMLYIVQGNSDTYVCFGQYHAADGQNYLRAYMVDPNEESYVMSKPITINTKDWMHVVATYDNHTGDIRLYLDGEDVTGTASGNQRVLANYAGVGPIALGAHPKWEDRYFEGRMLETRIWNKVLNTAEIEQTKKRQLTGYENGLALYYTFDEGRGTYATDKVGGSVLKLNGLTWTNPEGRALALNDEAITLKNAGYNVAIGSDYTFSMWFRILNETDSVNLFDGNAIQLALTKTGIILNTVDPNSGKPEACYPGRGEWMDAQWHLLAVTANHSSNTGNVYIDNMSVCQFNCSRLYSPTADPVIGPMMGQIDDICFWEKALPDYYLRNFYRQTPNNSEMGLLSHLSFSERVLSEDGDHYYTRYNPYNDRIRKDELGNILPRTEEDRLVLTPDSLLSSHLVENAPIQDKGDLVKLGFNWIGRDNELVINLKMMDKEINKQNIFVTVRNVEDLAGNPQASPWCWTLFVDRNRLRWADKYLETTLSQGESKVFNLDILNQGGTLTNYYIEQLPWWLTVNAQQGSLSPLEQRPISLRISDKLDPGEYETIIYLTDDNELSEPLRVRAVVQAHQPDWKVDTDKSSGETMNLFANVQIVGALGAQYFDTDTADIVSAYLGNICIGVEHIMYQDDRSLLCMSLEGSNDPSFTEAVQNHTPIRFLLWRAQTGKIYALNPVEDITICYEPNTWVGRPDHPVTLQTTDYRNQLIDLQRGWNWISFYITPDASGRNFDDALNTAYTFHNGDFIKSNSSSQSYEEGEWQGIPMQFYNQYIYMVRVSEAGQMGVRGFTTPMEQRTVSIHGGWNHLPYINEQTQDINTALSSYRQQGKSGDVVKGYHSFAMLDDNMKWVGSLTHLQPGMGYMLYRQEADTVQLHYQISGSSDYQSPNTEAAAPLRYSHNMPIVATVAGVAEGDRLEAYEGETLVGMAEADAEGRFVMMTSADEDSRLSFHYYSAQGTQQSAPVVRYRSAAPSVGTMENPYLIGFDTDMATVYPDPFVDHITYSGVLAEEGKVELSLYSVDGQQLWSHLLDLSAGAWSYTLDHTAAYPQGVYVAIIRSGENATRIKLIKE